MKKLITLIAVPLAFFAASAYAGGDAAAGKEVFSNVCEDCHYEDDFAGTSEDEMLKMIKAVVSGETEHDEDADFSGLTDEDFANVAAYYASFK